MLRRFYDWMISLSASPYAIWALGIISFAESSFFPFPPDVMLVPMTVARPERAFTYAFVCTITSVAGGVFGYAIGALLFDTVGRWLIEFYGYQSGMEEFRQLYAHWGAWIILIKGITPIPYKLVTIASGFAGYDLVWFIILSLITRGARFYILAGILNRYGAPIRTFMEAHLGAVTAAMAAFIIGGFVLARYMM